MFKGEYDHTIDDKGRVILPAKLRSDLGKHFYMTKGYKDPCVWIFTDEGWESFSDSLDKRPQLDSKTLMLKRFFTALDGDIDGQGRISIPQKLREYAQISLSSQVTVVGTGSRIEVWSTVEWNTYQNSITADMLAEAGADAGL